MRCPRCTVIAGVVTLTTLVGAQIVSKHRLINSQRKMIASQCGMIDSQREVTASQRALIEVQRTTIARNDARIELLERQLIFECGSRLTCQHTHDEMCYACDYCLYTPNDAPSSYGYQPPWLVKHNSAAAKRASDSSKMSGESVIN